MLFRGYYRAGLVCVREYELVIERFYRMDVQYRRVDAVVFEKLSRLQGYVDHIAVRGYRHVGSVRHNDALADLEFIRFFIEKYGSCRPAETQVNGTDEIDRRFYGRARFRRVGGAYDSHAGDRSHNGEILEALMRRAVFADGDAAVRGA